MAEAEQLDLLIRRARDLPHQKAAQEVRDYFSALPAWPDRPRRAGRGHRGGADDGERGEPGAARDLLVGAAA